MWCAGVVASVRDPRAADAVVEPVAAAWDQISQGVPLIGNHPRWTAALVGGAGLAGCGARTYNMNMAVQGDDNRQGSLMSCLATGVIAGT